EDDAHDLEALDGLVEILSASGKVRALVDALLERANVRAGSPPESEKDATASREDRVRAARILSSELDARSEAIAVWELVRKTTGDTDDVDAALAELQEREERWKDLAELLSRG